MFDLPENLIINLKRYKSEDNFVQKNHQDIKIKSTIYLDDIMIHKVEATDPKRVNQYHTAIYDDLDKEYEGQHQNLYRYNLYAVIAHIGEIMSGHYVTFIKYKYLGDEHWIMYDKTRQC